MIFWADSGTVNAINGAKDIAVRMGELTGYELMPVSKSLRLSEPVLKLVQAGVLKARLLYRADPEDGTDEPHDDTEFDSLVWEKVKYIGLFLAEEALKR